MAFELRPIVEHDLPDLIEFWSRTPGIGLNESDTPECLKIFLDRNPGLSLIALAGDRIAGALLSGHDGRRGYLHHLAVAEPFRRQGLGRELCRAVPFKAPRGGHPQMQHLPLCR
jgi:putative acetyltransferase